MSVFLVCLNGLPLLCVRVFTWMRGGVEIRTGSDVDGLAALPAGALGPDESGGESRPAQQAVWRAFSCSGAFAILLARLLVGGHRSG
jgi:hypothetical protein